MKGLIKDLHFGASYLLFKRAEELIKFFTCGEEIVSGYL